jgi:glycosyltransferase involved in cell wall biosynthesis
MRVLHFITDLHVAGTQLTLLRLLAAERDWGWESAVITLADGKLGSEVTALGIPVFSLGMRSGASTGAQMSYLVRLPAIMPLTWRWRPQVIQGWMQHANLAASLAAACRARATPVFWNIQRSLHDLSHERRSAAVLIRAGRLISRQPAAIIYNTEVGARQHETLGYSSAQRVVIRGGFDCELFRPSLVARRAVRRELGIEEDAILIGLMARLHPMKNHAGFLEAAGTMARQYPKVYFVLAGTGITSMAPELTRGITEHRLEGRVFLLGERRDMPRLNAALDIACSSSSHSEGFSNSIGEAMACGVPCVVTDVGDSAQLVGNTGVVVPPNDPAALTSAIARLIDEGAAGRGARGVTARRRIEGEFSLESVAQRYRALYDAQTLAKARA